MASTKSQKLVEELNKLQVASTDIQASAIVSADGLIIASALPRNVEEDRVSAMSAAMLSLGERISLEVRRGDLDQVYIRGDNGYVMLMAVGTDAVLTILAGVNAKLGLIFLEIRRAAEALEEFDSRMPQIMDALSSDDLLVITADHGCDPTYQAHTE